MLKKRLLGYLISGAALAFSAGCPFRDVIPGEQNVEEQPQPPSAPPSTEPPISQPTPPSTEPPAPKINRAPTTENIYVRIKEDNPALIKLEGKDPDKDPLIASVTKMPDFGKIDLRNNIATYIPNENYFGNDGFKFKVNDGKLDSSESDVAIEIEPVNDRPTVSAIEAIIEGTIPKVITLAGKDIEEDELTYGLVSLPVHGAATINGKELTYRLRDVNFMDKESFLYKAFDGKEWSESASINLLVKEDAEFKQNKLKLAEKISRLNWISYAPRNYDPDKGIIPTEESVKSDIKLILGEGFNGIILYGDSRLNFMPQVAKESGVEGVIAGVWDLKNENEIMSFIAKKDFYDAICIGNEGLDSRYNFSDLEKRLKQGRNETKKPVTTTEQFEDYFKNKGLIDATDFVLPNIHPFWVRIYKPEEAVAHVVDVYKQLKDISGNKLVLIKETGLPSSGDYRASETRQKKFLEFLSVNPDVKFSYFEAFDQFWKNWSEVEPFWGVHHADGRRKMFLASKYNESLEGIIALTFLEGDPYNPTDQGIMIINASNGEKKVVEHGKISDNRVLWSPDGDTLVYKIDEKIRFRNKEGEIVCEVDSPPRFLYEIAKDFVWSSDSKKIAFGNYYDGLYVYTIGEKSAERVLKSQTATYDHNPVFSPDGKKVGYVHHEFGRNGYIRILDLNTKISENIYLTETDHDAYLSLQWANNNLIFSNSRSNSKDKGLNRINLVKNELIKMSEESPYQISSDADRAAYYFRTGDFGIARLDTGDWTVNKIYSHKPEKGFPYYETIWNITVSPKGVFSYTSPNGLYVTLPSYTYPTKVLCREEGQGNLYDARAAITSP